MTDGLCCCRESILTFHQIAIGFRDNLLPGLFSDPGSGRCSRTIIRVETRAKNRAVPDPSGKLKRDSASGTGRSQISITIKTESTDSIIGLGEKALNYLRARSRQV